MTLCICVVSYSRVVFSLPYRGAAAAGRRLQEKRQRAEEQDVVEEHEGMIIIDVSLLYLIIN